MNLSPLSLGFAGVSVEQGVSTHARGLERLVEAFGARVTLVPHVVCAFNAQDDDAGYLRKVRSAIREPLRDRVDLLDTDPGFVGAKKALVQCDLAVAARMHCAINAVASHVPTVFLAYSRKARGMADFVYGDQRCVLSVEEFKAGAQMENVVASCIDRRVALQAYLGSRLRDIREASARTSRAALEEVAV